MPRRLDDEMRPRVPMLVDARTNTATPPVSKGLDHRPARHQQPRFIKFPGATTKDGLATAGTC